MATPAGAHLFNIAKALDFQTARSRSLRLNGFSGLFQTQKAGRRPGEGPAAGVMGCAPRYEPPDEFC
jgi:hypothetical protein